MLSEKAVVSTSVFLFDFRVADSSRWLTVVVCDSGRLVCMRLCPGLFLV